MAVQPILYIIKNKLYQQRQKDRVNKRKSQNPKHTTFGRKIGIS